MTVLVTGAAGFIGDELTRRLLGRGDSEDSALIDKHKEVLNVVERFPATQAVFEAYETQAGECICCNALFQTIEEVAARYSLELPAFLEDINRAARG
jgi:nucleoside-diphosphate-sugar epimerase